MSTYADIVKRQAPCSGKSCSVCPGTENAPVGNPTAGGPSPGTKAGTPPASDAAAVEGSGARKRRKTDGTVSQRMQAAMLRTMEEDDAKENASTGDEGTGACAGHPSVGPTVATGTGGQRVLPVRKAALAPNNYTGGSGYGTASDDESQEESEDGSRPPSLLSIGGHEATAGTKRPREEGAKPGDAAPLKPNDYTSLKDVADMGVKYETRPRGECSAMTLIDLIGTMNPKECASIGEAGTDNNWARLEPKRDPNSGAILCTAQATRVAALNDRQLLSAQAMGCKSFTPVLHKVEAGAGAVHHTHVDSPADIPDELHSVRVTHHDELSAEEPAVGSTPSSVCGLRLTTALKGHREVVLRWPPGTEWSHGADAAGRSPVTINGVSVIVKHGTLKKSAGHGQTSKVFTFTSNTLISPADALKAYQGTEEAWNAKWYPKLKAAWDAIYAAASPAERIRLPRVSACGTCIVVPGLDTFMEEVEKKSCMSLAASAGAHVGHAKLRSALKAQAQGKVLAEDDQKRVERRIETCILRCGGSVVRKADTDLELVCGCKGHTYGFLRAAVQWKFMCDYQAPKRPSMPVCHPCGTALHSTGEEVQSVANFLATWLKPASEGGRLQWDQGLKKRTPDGSGRGGWSAYAVTNDLVRGWREYVKKKGAPTYGEPGGEWATPELFWLRAWDILRNRIPPESVKELGQAKVLGREGEIATYQVKKDNVPGQGGKRVQVKVLPGWILN